MPRRITIVGAGICGLTLAQGLKKKGIPFAIVEAASSAPYRRDWNIGLHWGTPILKSLLPDKLASQLDTIASKNPNVDEAANRTMSVFDGASGRLVKEVVLEEPFLRISRKKLWKLCAAGIDIKYDHRVSSIQHDEEGSVTMNFANGSSQTSDIVIGTDGPRSFVRQHLFGEARSASQPLNATYLSTIFSYKDAEKTLFALSANPVQSSTIHPNGKINIAVHEMPDPSKPETWFVQLAIVWAGPADLGLTNQQKHEQVREKFRTLCEPYRSAIMWIPEGVELHYIELSSWVPEPFDTQQGRITLAGDALHTMPPFRGQGLNNALLDASKFIDAVAQIEDGKQEQGQAVQAYTEEAVARGKRETELGMETARQTLGYVDFEKTATMKIGLRQTGGENEDENS